MQAAGAKTDTDLAKALGIKPPSVAAAKKRGQIPSGWVELIAENHSVSADWLLFGAEQNRPELRPICLGATDENSRNCPAVCDVDLVYVPLVEARLSAGTGSFETGGQTERLYAFRADFLARKGSTAQMVLMRVTGNSMEPDIRHDDVVLIDQGQTEPTAGGLFAVSVESVVYIKLLDTAPGKLILKSANPSYPVLEIDARGDLADGIRIIGRALWLGREIQK